MLLGVAWWGGEWLAERDLRFWLVAVGCVLVIAAWFVGYEVTYAALHLIPWDDALFYERLPLYVAIVVLLSVCLRRLDRRTMRVAVVTIGVIFSLYSIAEVAAPIPLPLFAERLSSDTDGPAEVTQSTGWSCGAAALAWAARLHGIPASERQMAELAAIAPLRGTSVRGMLRALHGVGLEARAMKPASWNDVVAAPKPALIGWKLSRTVAHSALLLEVRGDEVTVGDPLTGRVTYSRDEFLDGWMRDMIVIARPDGTADAT